MSPRTISWLVFFVLLSCIGLRVAALRPTPDTDALDRQRAAYQYVRSVIRENYVKDVDDRKLLYGALNGMTAALDRHSQFLTPSEYEALRTSTTGQFEGVGIEFSAEDGQGIFVLTPLQDSPAYRGGVFPGDKLLKVDDTVVTGMKLDEVGRRIRGPIGSPVRLTLLHEGQTTPVEVVLTRAVNEIKSIQVAELLPASLVPDGKKIGYVQLAQFQQRTASHMDAALKVMEAQGMQALLLDLRQNPGGLLDAAEQVADLFLSDGEIVRVITRSAAQSKSKGTVATAEADGTHPDYPLAILVDGHSASASEIVSGALKDRGRAVLVGDKTYGKFSVQDVFPVPLGDWGRSALKLTIARYQTPLSPCIDGQGLVPDYLVPFTPEQQRGLQISRMQRHVHDNDPRGEKAPPQKGEPFNDLQLKKAIEVLCAKLNGAKGQ
ncbi:MAG TPA: S41 family peptidase [Planctomycetota bacterium]|jgi:carboxyl-terminal processing protease